MKYVFLISSYIWFGINMFEFFVLNKTINDIQSLYFWMFLIAYHILDKLDDIKESK